MKTARSADGTEIAFDQLGGGPPVVMVVGAFNLRSTTAPLAEALAHALPNGQRRSLPGQTHDIDPGATAPVLAEFLAG